jgi:hypothetical protein
VEVAITGEASRSNSMRRWGRLERVGREGRWRRREGGTVSQHNADGLADVDDLQKVGPGPPPSQRTNALDLVSSWFLPSACLYLISEASACR